MNKIESALQVLDGVGEDEVILMCSLGKDSLVCLDLAASKFKKVYCVFMYFVKGMEHIQRYANWVKARYKNVEFVEVPHWNLTYIMRGGMYCVPNPHQKLYKLADVCKAMRAKFGVNTIILGMKKADSINRNCMLKTYADNGYQNNGNVYPLAEWTQKDILSYMKHHKLPTPVRYGKNASSGCGFNEDFFVWLENNCPQDLDKIYEIFPLSRRILFEYHSREDKRA